jgi:hypothetical protein
LQSSTSAAKENFSPLLDRKIEEVGSHVFTIADMIAEKKGGGARIPLGTGLDSIPESLAIGAAITFGPYLALSLIISIQNVYQKAHKDRKRLPTFGAVVGFII